MADFIFVALVVSIGVLSLTTLFLICCLAERQGEWREVKNENKALRNCIETYQTQLKTANDKLEDVGRQLSKQCDEYDELYDKIEKALYPD